MCFWGMRVCVCAHTCVRMCACQGSGRCHHTSNAVAGVSSLGKMYHSLLAPTGKIFSHARKVPLFNNIIGISAFCKIQWDNLQCATVWHDKKRDSCVSSPAKPLQERGSGPFGVMWAGCREAGERVELGSLLYRRTQAQTSSSMKCLHSPYLGVSFYFLFELSQWSSERQGEYACELLEPAGSLPRSERCHCNSNREAVQNGGGQGLCLLFLLPLGNSSVWHLGC